MTGTSTNGPGGGASSDHPPGICRAVLVLDWCHRWMDLEVELTDWQEHMLASLQVAPSDMIMRKLYSR